MKPLAIALSAALIPIALGGNAWAGNTVQLTILGTTDIHGHIYPTNYANKTEDVGLAKIQTLVKKYRKENPNTILVDSGDALQGTPLVYYAMRFTPNKPNPMIATMNKMGYSAFAVGNHEFNFGLPGLTKAKKEAKFPFLSANVYRGNSPAFTPYVIKEVAGVKIGIIGFTPPGVALWDKGNVEGKLTFKDIVKSAERWMPEVRKKSDVVVALVHAGLGDKYGPTYSGYAENSGLPPENVGVELAKKFPIDVMLLGHTHERYAQEAIGNTVAAQARKWGECLAVVNLSLEKTGKGWKVVSKKSDAVWTKGVTPDPEIMAQNQPLENKTLAYLGSPIAKTTEEWPAQDADIKDTPIIDLINAAQIAATKADLSAASVFNPKAKFPKGGVSITEVTEMYPYENTLVAIKINGKQLKDYLEHSALYYNSYTPGQGLVDPNVAMYNYDMVSGVNYSINIAQKPGQRIMDLTYKGKPVTDSMTFTLALNSYRQRGGGGYDMFKDAPIVYNKEEGIRELLIEYLKKRKVLKTSEIHKANWKLVPNEALDLKTRQYK